MKPSHRTSRRELLAVGAAAASVMIVPRHVLGGPRQVPPSEKLNVAAVGVGGMGTGDIRNAAGENVVALCDVDENALNRNAKVHPKARLHRDFRKMLETQKDIDAVMVATPGHYVEWIAACKGGAPAGSNFVDHAAHLAEVVLLGNIAIRSKQKLLWDAENPRFTNSQAANKLISPPYRKGWTL